MFDFSAKGCNRLAKISCGMCGLFMVVAAVFALYRWSFLNRAITTKAKITNLVTTTSREGGTLYAPVYIFTDQRGETVKIISSTASFPPPGEIGDTIEVLYDPDNPQQSIENRFFSIWGFPAILGGLGAFYSLVSGAVVFFTGRHLTRNIEPGSSADKPRSHEGHG